MVALPTGNCIAFIMTENEELLSVTPGNRTFWERDRDVLRCKNVLVSTVLELIFVDRSAVMVMCNRQFRIGFNADPDPGSQTSADPCRSGSLGQTLKKLNF
jgi:hypothetical protein